MYNFIHIEASGVGNGSYPIEIGVALVGGARRCTLVCPPEDWLHWEVRQRAATLTRDRLLVNGRSVLEVALLLNEWLGDDVVYSDAWGNDVCWLDTLYRRAGVKQRFHVESINVLLSGCNELAWQLGKSAAIESCTQRRWRASNRAAALQTAVMAQQSSRQAVF